MLAAEQCPSYDSESSTPAWWGCIGLVHDPNGGGSQISAGGVCVLSTIGTLSRYGGRRIRCRRTTPNGRPQDSSWQAHGPDSITTAMSSDEKKVAVTAASAVAGETTILANGNVMEDGLQRGLKDRHLIMISFGGVVGASIWYGTGYAVAYSGPVGALLCFFVIGLDVYFVMQCLGEMATVFPIQGAFTAMAGRWLDPALAFALGWNYYYLWLTNIAADFNASAILMSYWVPPTRVPTYAWVLVWWAAYQATSLLGVVVFGEMEFWLACWKVLCILGGYLVAVLLNTGAIGGRYTGFAYWRDPGPVAHGINGFGQCFLLAAVYYCGTEMLAVTAAESQNPGRDLPRAIRQTFWRCAFIFQGLVFFAGLLVPSDSPELLTASSKSGKSPWTIAFERAGAPQLGHVVNVVMLTAQFSSMNSALYVASRSLAALAAAGRAPRFFARTNRSGTPVYALVFSNAVGLVAILNYRTGPALIFSYLTSISGSATYIAWAFIGIVPLMEADLATGRRMPDPVEQDASGGAEDKPVPWYIKAKRSVFA
ncbi:agp3-like amino acid permease [Grosmannia clavigera kw1407]|uniref:Agp3-like amino acid permease n=1 Tax=Grosmannia clavigera (strain kw1407 / UAMH 11150) TaxID=655863 RepID=F0XTM6_GROCL|nr:agp3-like amino acid permease [Grosmannia clavigera kw1407]EFW98586.1 agp3-like amino acid permease [Grosmannia clavigera kw1407]